MKVLFIVTFIVGFILSSELCLASEFNDYINKDYEIVIEDNSDDIRQDYIDCFGVDIWYPYFKLKEIEKTIRTKLTFNIGQMKAVPIIDKKYKQFGYKFIYGF